jgi:hypothetical protein
VVSGVTSVGSGVGFLVGAAVVAAVVAAVGAGVEEEDSPPPLGLAAPGTAGNAGLVGAAVTGAAVEGVAVGDGVAGAGFTSAGTLGGRGGGAITLPLTPLTTKKALIEEQGREIVSQES